MGGRRGSGREGGRAGGREEGRKGEGERVNNAESKAWRGKGKRERQSEDYVRRSMREDGGGPAHV